MGSQLGCGRHANPRPEVRLTDPSGVDAKLHLHKQYQNTDPFKFIIYSCRAHEQVPPM
jgi:hypothetical protein